GVFVDRAIWPECVEYERKRDVVGDIDKRISLSPLYDDVADVTARGGSMPYRERMLVLAAIRARDRRSRWCLGAATERVPTLGGLPAGSRPPPRAPSARCRPAAICNRGGAVARSRHSRHRDCVRNCAHWGCWGRALGPEGSDGESDR